MSTYLMLFLGASLVAMIVFPWPLALCVGVSVVMVYFFISNIAIIATVVVSLIAITYVWWKIKKLLKKGTTKEDVPMVISSEVVPNVSEPAKVEIRFEPTYSESLIVRDTVAFRRAKKIRVNEYHNSGKLTHSVFGMNQDTLQSFVSVLNLVISQRMGWKNEVQKTNSGSYTILCQNNEDTKDIVDVTTGNGCIVIKSLVLGKYPKSALSCLGISAVYVPEILEFIRFDGKNFVIENE